MILLSYLSTQIKVEELPGHAQTVMEDFDDDV